jgi:ribose transport system substrate-binding protein
MQMRIFFLFLFILNLLNASQIENPNKKILIYMIPDKSIPFWNIMARGIEDYADKFHYELEIYDAKNETKIELENIIKAIKNKASGIIISPLNSSSCVTILKLAKEANIPIVISDVGADDGEYVSYISSNNNEGAYMLGNILAKKMLELGWENKTVGIVAIPQKKLNGQERTAGFMKALSENNIKGADLKQQITWSKEETYKYSKEMINNYPNIGAIWLQTSNGYEGAIQAIKDTNKQNDIILITFDAEPIFLELIPKGIILASAMQQPYLMGQKAVIAMHNHLEEKKVQKIQQVPIIPISIQNITEKLPIIKQNVLGLNKVVEIK